MKKLRLIDNVSILLIGMMLCGLLSIYLGKELCWDLANYHYYNPHAFFYNRFEKDYWPSSFIHVHFNPTIDFLSYFLINNFSSIAVVFILGAIHGVNFWLLYRIALVFLSSYGNRDARGLALVFAVLGLYGPAAFSGIGSFQNDDLISIFVLSFVLLQLKAVSFYTQTKQLQIKLICAAGLMLGIGTGLKLTAALFVVGSGLAILLLPIRFADRVRWILFFGFAVAFGICLSSGYWMMILWKKYHNPFFPFYNGIFHSPDFLPVNFNYTQFLPQDFLHILFYPFYVSWQGTLAEGMFQDFRFPLVYLLFIVVFFRWIWKKREDSQGVRPSLNTTWLFVFFIGSYIVWEYYFAIIRYCVALEMLAPLLIYLLARKIISDNYFLTAFLTVVFSIMVFMMVPLRSFRVACHEPNFFNVHLPTAINQKSEAMVLLAYPAYALSAEPKPQAYLIPFFPSSWRFVGVPFLKGNYLPDMNAHKNIQDVINKYSGHFYLLTTDVSMPELYRTARTFGLVTQGDCYEVSSERQKMSSKKVLLCPVSKVS